MQAAASGTADVWQPTRSHPRPGRSCGDGARTWLVTGCGPCQGLSQQNGEHLRAPVDGFHEVLGGAAARRAWASPTDPANAAHVPLPSAWRCTWRTSWGKPTSCCKELPAGAQDAGRALRRPAAWCAMDATLGDHSDCTKEAGMTKAKFSSAEWKSLLNAPHWVYVAITAGSPAAQLRPENHPQTATTPAQRGLPLHLGQQHGVRLQIVSATINPLRKPLPAELDSPANACYTGSMLE